MGLVNLFQLPVITLSSAHLPSLSIFHCIFYYQLQRTFKTPNFQIKILQYSLPWLSMLTWYKAWLPEGEAVGRTLVRAFLRRLAWTRSKPTAGRGTAGSRRWSGWTGSPPRGGRWSEIHLEKSRQRLIQVLIRKITVTSP